MLSDLCPVFRRVRVGHSNLRDGRVRRSQPAEHGGALRRGDGHLELRGLHEAPAQRSRGHRVVRAHLRLRWVAVEKKSLDS